MGTVPASGATRSLDCALDVELEVSSKCITEYHLTGFSTFHNVKVNPTQLIAEALPEALAEHPLKSNALLASCRVLEVSAETTRRELCAMYSNLEVPSHPVLVGRSRKSRRIVFLHLGVNVCVSRFHLEIQGKNEATFTCPDQLGWKPVKMPVDANNSDLSAAYQTTIKLDPLVTDLRSKGYGVDISTDAGRFVCNWVYYNSLQMAKTAGAESLFIHVPPASVVPIERQVQFVCALLDSVSAFQ